MNNTPIRKKIILILFGLFVGFLLFATLLEIGLRIQGFLFVSSQEQRNTISLKQKSAYRILCLGTCTTALGGRNSYPSQLEEILNERNIGIKFSVINKGVPAIELSYILARLEDNLNRYNPQIVILIMGLETELGAGKNYYKSSGFSEQIQNSNKEKLKHENTSNAEAISTKWYNVLRIYKLVRDLWFGIGSKITKNEELNSREAKELFKKAIKSNPRDESAYLNLGIFYKNQGKLQQAKELFKKAIKLSPRNEFGYIYLGQCYKEEGNHKQAEELFNRAITSSAGSGLGYVELAKLYKEQKKYILANELIKKALQATSENYLVYMQLGRLYEIDGNFTQAAKMFKEAIEKNPREALPLLYNSLGQCYKEEGKYVQAEELFKKAIELSPLSSNLAYLELGWLYRDWGDLIRAEKVFQKALQRIPGDYEITQALALLYEGMNKEELAEQYYNLANKSKLKDCFLEARDYYLKIKKILDKKGIKLVVCMLNPLQSVEPLKRIFEGQSGVIFVDNEKIFKNALKEGSHKEYFIDVLGGDFGHCTAKGNRLIAENIANTILKEFFNK